MRKKREVVLVAFLMVFTSFVAAGSKSNVLQNEWDKTYGGDEYDFLYCVQQTADGGYIASGVTTQSEIQYAWVIKLDGNGDVEWEKKEMGNDVYIQPSYIQQTSDGGYIVCGVFNSPDAKFGYYKSFLWKLDDEGNTQWIKTFYERLWVVFETSDGYIGGGYDALSNNDYDAMLMKLDSMGNMEWKKLYRYGAGYDYGYSLGKTNDNGYLIGGYVSKAGDTDMWLIKTDENGNKIWAKTYGGSKDDWSAARNCFQTSDGYIMAGETKSFGNGNNDVWIVKTDKNGNMVWNKTYGGKRDDRIWGMDKVFDGYLLCITKAYSAVGGTADIWIVKIDENGEMLWNQTFGGSREDRGYYIQQTENGGYIVAGRTESFGGSSDGWLIKVENVPPNRPERPQGEANGHINENYTYSTSTIDSNGDEIYYMWDWGDNTTTGWIGPFNSGETVKMNHTWKEKGTYMVRVKAKDVSGKESPWSDPMVVTMPKKVTILQQLERYPFIYMLLKFLFPSFHYSLFQSFSASKSL